MKTSFLLSIVCYCTLLVQTCVPNTMASRVIPNVDEYMIEDQRTHTRQNYVVQRALDDDIEETADDIGPAYVTDSFEPHTRPEELPALIVDYANMIRNDIILLDNSVETRTRKRGNIKKHNQAIIDPKCSCESYDKTIFLGNTSHPAYPSEIKNKICIKDSCLMPYRCIENKHDITVLRRRAHPNEHFSNSLPPPPDFPSRWVLVREQITTGCACARDGTVPT